MLLRPSSTDPPSALTLAEAAVLLASGRGVAGRRLQQAVESQLTRHAALGSDHDDVRADVVYALLLSKRDDRLTLAAACALVAGIARNKAVDQHRRRRREMPGAVALLVAGSPAGDLDVVSAEVHRRDVSLALRQLVGDLPPSERRALTATATGAGHAGSGLARSSHYRALDRARIRLSSAVRSRIAGGLALPAALLRKIGFGRSILAPAGALLAGGIASVALVLPATGISVPAYAQATAAAHMSPLAISVAARSKPAPQPPPPRLVHRRTRKPAVSVAPHHLAPHRDTRATVKRVAPTPAAGLGPCRAARLCQ